MKSKKVLTVLIILIAAGAAAWYFTHRQPTVLSLTGIVTTDEVVVSSQVPGRLSQLAVNVGDTVKAGQLLAVILPLEQKADVAYFAHTEQQSSAQVAQAEADLKYQEAQTADQTRQAEANLAAAEAAVAEAKATLENASLDLKRNQALYQQGVASAQVYDQARTTFAADQAHVAALEKQAQAAQAAVALARSNAQQIASRRAMLEASRHQLAAAGAQKTKAQVQLGYTEIRSPVDGTVDVRAALEGEVVNPAQPIVTLVNPDNLWVRADVPETYLDGIHLGDKFTVRLPSGAEREGTVFYRGADADYATQRDVSRTKRDIK
ncbi:MAG TPA: efflux RND transporter periplasmic adaptor subunit, partial [Terriglobia bacterium]|nr:efflux RND transporter periplasmic adaptor subunit [Terriglobia bacterium]